MHLPMPSAGDTRCKDITIPVLSILPIVYLKDVFDHILATIT